MLLFFTVMSPSQSGRQDDMIELCIKRIAESDKEALAALYEKTHAAVYGFALSLIKNRQDAEDIVHDTYLQIWRAADQYRPIGKPLAWIFTITRNLALMQLRAQTRTVTISPEDWQTVFADKPDMNQEDRLILAALLDTLSDEERQIIMLHITAGMKHREIAEFLNLRLSTVLSKYSRALKKLRRTLKEID